jgi:hypothetical protein
MSVIYRKTHKLGAFLWQKYLFFWKTKFVFVLNPRNYFTKRMELFFLQRTKKKCDKPSNNLIREQNCCRKQETKNLFSKLKTSVFCFFFFLNNKLLPKKNLQKLIYFRSQNFCFFTFIVVIQKFWFDAKAEFKKDVSFLL